jgi:maltooligosyltrehalose trehalohydrolase
MELGARVQPGGVQFRVWAPQAQRVEVVLGGKSMGMEPCGDGTWAITIAGAAAGDRYGYRVDDQGPYPDPYSRSQPDGPHGESEVIDPEAYEWHDQGWHTIAIDGLSIYEVHVGTFTPEGTFESAIQQLPRLQELGVTAIEPMPVAEFPGTRNWGYDGVDLFAPSHVYGGPTGLKRLVDAAHQRGLGVILDVVYNHLGPDGNYLRQYANDYFTDRYKTPWGEAVNYSSPWVRRFVLDNARYWMSEFHIDGLRLDATHAIYDSSPTHILAELSESVDGLLIAETHENDVRYLKPVNDGGFGIDAVWADDFHHALRRYLAGDHEGYYARFAGTLDEVARAVQQGWLRGEPAWRQPARQFVFVIQNHDQVGNRPFGDRLNHDIDLELYKAASLLLLFLPETPLLFMGQEFAASTPFQYFTDHNPELGRLVTEGRRREFKSFSAFSDPASRERIPDPQAVETFLRSKLRVGEASRPPGAEVLELYAAMLRLRREDPVLADQARQHMHAEAATKDVLLVRRWRAGQERLLVANFGDVSYTVEPGWRVLLQTNQPGYPRSAAVLARP